MTRRSSIIDDKLMSEMILKNITTASQMNFEMSDILNIQQMRILTTYKETYNYESHLSFFLSLGMMSHFSQGSYYTHYASSDHRPVQLYLWLLGASGSGKTHAFRQIEKAITKTEKMFSHTYLKPVIVNGKPTETDLSSVITHTNHIGLRQHLASNSKILLNDDADLIAETYGLYNVNDYTKEHERNIILCGYDGNTSRTTGTTIIQIDDKRLTIAIATTGGKLMKNWLNSTGFDGSHNRFLYMSIPKLIYSRPQDFKVNVNSKNNPTFNHLCIIIHLFGTARYVFQMSESERTKFCGATFHQASISLGEDEQTQTQHNRSAMFTVWNLIADLVETQDQKPNEQQQIIDFYAKAGTTFPRLACLMQLYFNAIDILERVKDTVIFVEGDNQDLIINDSFVSRVEKIIKKDYYVYDKTYLPCDESNHATMDPMIIIEKEVVIAAWKWYDHHLNIATKLFTIDHEYSGKPITISSSFPSKPKTLKELILQLDFNIFPLSAISVKHPITGNTGIIKNRPALGERALQELLKANLLKFNYFLTDARGRNVKSYMKTPIPSIDDPTREHFLNTLLKHDINLDEYCCNYKKSSIPPNNNFSKLTIETFEHNASFVAQYSKYKSQLNSVIQKHIENHNIEETEEGNFIIINRNAFFRKFNDIENLVSSERQEQIDNKSQSENFIDQPISKQIGQSLIQLTSTTATEFAVFNNPAEKPLAIQRQDSTEISTDLQHINIASNNYSFIYYLFAFFCIVISFFSEAFTLKEHDLSSDIDNSSTATFEKQTDVDQLLIDENSDDESSDISTQQIINKATNTYEKGTELIIKKAIQSIMTGRSVIYTKTDLTQICKKSSIRLEAVKRLVEANLLQYENYFWIEPNRNKKESQKNSKRILREGWLKKGPESESNASKFKFIQILQENVSIGYEDYLKSFYPQQDENVFTYNNWTLSNEFIDMIKSNWFYTQHIRWNIQRFRPCDVVTAEVNQEDDEEPLVTQVAHLSNSMKIITNNNPREIFKQQSIVNNDEEGETMHIQSTSVHSKRKADLSEKPHEYEIRTQPRRLKKN
ncbi:unnamed protein product [Rotaria magnacalcarata]|uniref:Uncharacterized protein n=2 Tax=Rotaria magnacalcarata TaxID=392030 RepID=A0A816UGH5_9BILA|nr:unnamed protein product [Rotaria magnacalcarata]